MNASTPEPVNEPRPPIGFLAKTRDLAVRSFAATRRGLAWLFQRGKSAFLRARASERMGRWRGPLRRVIRVTAIAGVLALFTYLAGSVCFQRVEPGTVGVKQANWGDGVEEVDHPPGLYFSPPGLHTWHRLDARTRVVAFGPESEGGQYPSLELRTAQGNTVEISATVPYRILPGRAHRIVSDGKKLGHSLRIKATVERVLQRELAQLEVVEYFDVDKRQTLCDRALSTLNAELDAHHVVAERVLVSGFGFPTTFEKKMQEEQLASQTERTNAVLARLRARNLENAFENQKRTQEEQTWKADHAAAFEAEKQVAHFQIEKQKLENQRLTHEMKVEKDKRLARLSRDLEQLEVQEREVPLAEKKQENAIKAHELEEEILALELELERAFEAERLALGVERLEARRRANKLASLELDREEQMKSSELALSLAEERASLEGEILVIQRQAREVVSQVEMDSATAIAKLGAEGEEAQRVADALREKLRADILATPGGRIYLAREAANNLSIQRVTLNANDPRVPSVLDLDSLVGLLVGEAEGD